jgi:hypothetical protein
MCTALVQLAVVTNSLSSESHSPPGTLKSDRRLHTPHCPKVHIKRVHPQSSTLSQQQGHAAVLLFFPALFFILWWFSNYFVTWKI